MINSGKSILGTQISAVKFLTNSKIWDQYHEPLLSFVFSLRPKNNPKNSPKLKKHQKMTKIYFLLLCPFHIKDKYSENYKMKKKRKKSEELEKNTVKKLVSFNQNIFWSSNFHFCLVKQPKTPKQLLCWLFYLNKL